MMPAVFNYTARTSEGRFVAGAVRSESVEQAFNHLRSRSLFVTALEKCDAPRALVPAIFIGLPVSASARLAFFRSLATLVHAGVQLRRALEVTIEECRDARLGEALRSVATDIEAGAALSTAMGRRPKEFAPLFTATIRAGEVGGALDKVLERLAEYLERDRAIRKRVTAALAYPTIVACAAFSLVVFLVANTVPAFASMFSEMHVDLPASTKILLAAGNALKSPLLCAALMLLPIVVIALFRGLEHYKRTAEVIDAVKLRLPVLGDLMRKIIVARFARTLGTLLQSGVDVMTALHASRDVVESSAYRKGIVSVADALREGDPLIAPLEQSGLFDALCMQLIRTGEETGRLDAMLLRVAEYYELDIETAVAMLGSIVEPALIIVLGAIVGTIVASIMVPLYSIIGSIK